MQEEGIPEPLSRVHIAVLAPSILCPASTVPTYYMLKNDQKWALGRGWLVVGVHRVVVWEDSVLQADGSGDCRAVCIA